MVRNLKELGPNLQKIVTRLLTNQDLLKLLYYTDKDPFAGADLTQEQIQEEVFEKLVKIVPRVGPKETAHSLISLRVVNGYTDSKNEDVILSKIKSNFLLNNQQKDALFKIYYNGLIDGCEKNITDINEK